MAEKDKELIEDIEKQEYKYGFTSDIETETIPRGLNEEVVRPDLDQEGRAGVDDRAPPEGLPSLAEYGASHVGASDDPSDRLPGRHLLCGAEALQETRVDGRSRSRTQTHVRQAGYSTRGTDGAGGCRRRCRDGLRIGQNDLQGDAGRKGNHLLFDVRGDSGLS